MLKAAGFKPAGKGSVWPQFRSADPGWHPWHINQVEAGQLLADIPRLTAFSRLFEQHPGIFDNCDPGESLFFPPSCPPARSRPKTSTGDRSCRRPSAGLIPSNPPPPSSKNFALSNARPERRLNLINFVAGRFNSRKRKALLWPVQFAGGTKTRVGAWHGCAKRRAHTRRKPPVADWLNRCSRPANCRRKLLSAARGSNPCCNRSVTRCKFNSGRLIPARARSRRRVPQPVHDGPALTHPLRLERGEGRGEVSIFFNRETLSRKRVLTQLR